MELPSVQSPGCHNTNVKVKEPKRVLHFSDGTLEEFSEDEQDSATPTKQDAIVDPKTMTWGPWLLFKAWAAGNTTLAAVDYMGEFLASVFGITTPKYQYEIDEYERLQKEKKETEERMKGWQQTDNSGKVITTEQPPPTPV